MKNLLDKLMERWVGVRMLEEEAKAKDVAEMLRINREEVRAHLRIEAAAASSKPVFTNWLGGEIPVAAPGEGSKYDLKLGEPDAVPESTKEDSGR